MRAIDTGQPSLRACVERVVVVAYREDTGQLQAAMEREGFAEVFVQRAIYTGEEQAYSRNFRCFMNHRDAWRKAAGRSGWTLIMEADFVPCAGFGSMRVPVPQPESPGMKWAFLYTAAPRIFWVETCGFLRGHQSTAVCYLVTGAVAAKLLLFWDDEVRRHGMGSYFPFDAHLNWTLMGMGCEAYFPIRSYGEHGGVPNPEHGEKGVASNDGRHRADVLAGPLAFLPPYAAGSRAKYVLVRIGARIKSIGRLLLGKWLVRVQVSDPPPEQLLRPIWTGIKRQLKA